jgi:hypothetical protein
MWESDRVILIKFINKNWNFIEIRNLDFKPVLNLKTGFQAGSQFFVKSGIESVSKPDLKSGLAPMHCF